MSGGMSQCSRNIGIPQFPMTSLKALSRNSLGTIKQSEISPPHVTLTQASRPSTTSAHGDFTGNYSSKNRTLEFFIYTQPELNLNQEADRLSTRSIESL